MNEVISIVKIAFWMNFIGLNKMEWTQKRNIILQIFWEDTKTLPTSISKLFWLDENPCLSWW
jgi:hypothetical protein